jgi:hypothetical protein
LRNLRVNFASRTASGGRRVALRAAAARRSFASAAAGAIGVAIAMSALPSSGGAQTALPSSLPAQAGDTPLGLSIVWRAAGRKLHDEISAWSVDAFSTDGKLVAIGDATGVRILRARDGASVRKLWPTFADQTVYALAVSKAGAVAVGRVGNVELFGADPRDEGRRFPCSGACGPVMSVAFSPDGALLAFQGARGLADRKLGLGSVSVVDVRSRRSVAQLDASAARARVGFSADGRRLLAASVTPFDDREQFGVRTWRVSDWRVTNNILGAQRVARSEGAIGGAEFAAAFERDGHLEVRDLAHDAVLWSAPLVPPTFDAPADGRALTLRLVEIARNGLFILSYEAPVTAGPEISGALVIRSAADGAVQAMYDAPDVTALAIAPDGKTFLYTVGSGTTYTALARVPM